MNYVSCCEIQPQIPWLIALICVIITQIVLIKKESAIFNITGVAQ